MEALNDNSRKLPGSEIVRLVLAKPLDWLKEFNLKRQAARNLTDFQKNAGVMPPYTPPHSAISIRHFERVLLVGLIAFCFFYGFTFAFLGIYAPIIVIIPLVILFGVVIWALPDVAKIPSFKLNAILICALTVVNIVWPGYLAISLPGLPWITATRIIAAPMYGILLLQIATSPYCREIIYDSIKNDLLLSRMLLAFALVVALNTVLSVNIGLSINKLITAFINWFGIFVSGCIYFRKPTAFRWVCFLVIMTMPFEFFICVWEYKIRAIPWIGHIPAIFKVDDDIIDTIVHNSGRAYTNQYRVHGTFYIPLSLGEFLGLSWPIAYYFIFTAKTILKRIMYVAILLMMLSMAVISGSRNAFATLAVGSAYCIVLWVVRYMRLNRRALLATAMPLLMAVAAGGFMVAALSVSRIRKLFTGDGSAQSSTDARVIQWQTGIPKVLSRPWGHGIGTGAQVLNYHDPGGFLTIDSYMLNLLIEYGIIGFAIYIFMFGLAIFLSVRLFLRYMKSDRAWYSATIGGVALCFLISKLVFSGEYNHWMVFLALAALLCEIAHLRQEQAKLVPT